MEFRKGPMESMNNVKNIAVVGGTGFIGTPLVDCLAKHDVNITVFGYNIGNIASQYSNVEYREFNIFDYDSVKTTFADKRYDGMIDLAWYCGAKLHGSPVNLDWVAATLNLAKTFAENGGKVFLGAGSMSEYDFSRGYFDEFDTPLTNKSLYGRAKASTFNVLDGYFATVDGFDFKWARIFNLFGENEKPSRLMPSVIRSILTGQPVNVSACTKFQDYSYVKDTVAAITKFFFSDVTGPVNICSGKAVKLRDIVDTICELLDYPEARVNFGAIPESFGDRFICGNNTRLSNEVGYEYQYSIRKGLMNMIESIKKELNNND